MKKHTLKKVFLLFLVGIFCAAAVFSFFPQPKALAASGPNVLLDVGQYCHHLDSLEDRVGPTSFRCDYAEEGLQNRLGCPDLFYPREFRTDPNDNSVVKTQWFTSQPWYKSCYQKAAAKYGFLAGSNCRQMKRNPDSQNWKDCEAAQNVLHGVLGCESEMFRNLGNGYWGPKDRVIERCENRLNDVGNVRLWIIVNGKAVKSDNPIKSGAVPNEEGAAASGGSNDDKDLADCSASGFSPLSWIICPIIDMASGTSDYIFGKIIQPILEDVDITTETNNGAYQAWQGFRILGNIILVGAMLALVYGTTRGGQ